MRKALFLILLIFPVFLIAVKAGSILITSSRISVAALQTEISTSRWGGIFGYATLGDMSESNSPVFVSGISGGVVNQINVSASNLLDNKHYLAALPEIGGIGPTYQILANQIENITEEDLESYGLFNSSNFPIFHPDYYGMSDNPKNTFCCENVTIKVAGIPYKAFKINLKQNSPFYLLKYAYNSTLKVPLFVSNMSTAISCLDGSSCNYQLLLPADKTYNFYIVPREPAYDIKVYVDGVETFDIPKTGLPYNITVFVYNKYTLEPAPNKDVIIYEENGNTIFSPYYPSGSTPRVMAIGKSNANGYVSFIIAPTATQTEANSYVLKAGLYWGEDSISAEKELNLVDATLSGGTKHISPSNLLDNSKATVVQMLQIEDSLYNWGKNYKAIKYTVNVYNNGSYYFINQSDGGVYKNATLKSGGVNYLYVNLYDSTTNSLVSGIVKPKEKGGLIILNPTNNPPVVGPKEHLHVVYNIPTGQGFVVVPTRIADIYANTSLEVYQNNIKVAEVKFSIDKDSTIPSGAAYYSNDQMQAKIVKALQVIDTLYYAYW